MRSGGEFVPYPLTERKESLESKGEPMTCIVGLVHRGQVWIGGDSAVSDSVGGIVTCAEPKVFRAGPYLIGAAGATRDIQKLQYGWTPPTPPPDVPLIRFMATNWMASVKEAMEPQEEPSCPNMLVSSGGSLLTIYGDFAIVASTHTYTAVGAGADVALGSLHSSTGGPEKRLLMALEASAEFIDSVRAPMIVLKA